MSWRHNDWPAYRLRPKRAKLVRETSMRSTPTVACPPRCIRCLWHVRRHLPVRTARRRAQLLHDQAVGLDVEARLEALGLIEDAVLIRMWAR